MSRPPIRIATRSSRLALWQAEYMAARLREVDPDVPVELVHISTMGDRDQSGPLNTLGTWGVFTREVQRAVLDGRADLAVHSLKDLPTQEVSGLVLACVPDRAPTADVIVRPTTAAHATGRSPSGADVAAALDLLPHGSRVGTGSLRRQAQLRHWRPDLQLSGIRGNVETRLRKLDEGEFDAIVLAQAGLERLGLGDRVTAPLGPPLMFAAVGQGALGIECRTDDADLRARLGRISNPAVLAAVTGERALLASLRAGCHAPVGVASRIEGERLTLAGVVLSHDGQIRLHAERTDLATQAADAGARLAEQLREQGADALIQSAAEK